MPGFRACSIVRRNRFVLLDSGTVHAQAGLVRAPNGWADPGLCLVCRQPAVGAVCPPDQGVPPPVFDPTLAAFSLRGDIWAVFPAILLLIYVGAVVQGAVGLGMGLVAAPPLALFAPEMVPGPLLFLGVLVSMLAARREFAAMDRRFVVLGSLVRVPAALLAAMTVAFLPPQQFAAVFGALVLTAILLSVSGWRVVPRQRTLLAAAFASGYMGTVTAIGGPPLAIVFQHLPGPRVRATLSGFFSLGGGFSIFALACFGQFGWEQLMLALAALPALALGFLTSSRLLGTVDRGFLRTALLTTAALSAAMLIGRAVWG